MWLQMNTMFGSVDTLMNKGLTLLATFLISSVTMTAALEESPCSTCLRVNATCYNATLLLDLEAPFRSKIIIHKLGIMHSSNTLFFSFEPTITDPEYSKIGFVNLDSPGNASVISNKEYIMNFGPFDIDQGHALVYLGGSDGIYVLDTKANTVAPYSSRGDTVRSLFYKGHVYFVRYGEDKIVRKKADNFDILVDDVLVKNFVINRYNVIIFLTNYGLFAKRNKEITKLSNNPFIRGLVIDLDDVAYAWWVDGLYKVVIEINFSKSRLVKVADIPSIGALTFDNLNNFVFTTGRSVFKLVQTNPDFCL